MILCKVLEQGDSSDARVVDRAGALGEQLRTVKRQRDDEEEERQPRSIKRHSDNEQDEDEERQRRRIKRQSDDEQDGRLRKASGEPDSPIVID